MFLFKNIYLPVGVKEQKKWVCLFISLHIHSTYEEVCLCLCVLFGEDVCVLCGEVVCVLCGEVVCVLFGEVVCVLFGDEFFLFLLNIYINLIEYKFNQIVIIWCLFFMIFMFACSVRT